MKSSFLSLTVILLTVTFIPTSAQTTRGITGFGVQAGLSLASISGQDAASFGDSRTVRTGMTAGLFASYRIYGNFALQPELLYIRKGFANGSLLGAADIRWTLDYIEIPVLARIDFSSIGNLRPAIYAGPTVGFNINAQSKSKSVFPGNPEVTYKIRDIRSTEWGLALGANLALKLPAGAPFLSIRYNLGLTRIYTSAIDRDLKNNALAVMIGWSFK